MGRVERARSLRVPGEFLCRLVALTAGVGFLASSPRLRAAADGRNDKELAEIETRAGYREDFDLKRLPLGCAKIPGEFLCRLVGLTVGEGFLTSSPRLRAAADVRNDKELAEIGTRAGLYEDVDLKC